MRPTVYLAGPITGLSYDEATDWRGDAREWLAEHGINGLSPMRDKEYLSHIHNLPALKNAKEDYEYAQLGVMSTSRAIMTRDHFDCTRCSVLLVNLLGARRISIGTVMEIAWAWMARIPIVLVMEPESNPHEHGMLREATGFRVQTLEEGLLIVKSIIGL